MLYMYIYISMMHVTISRMEIMHVGAGHSPTCLDCYTALYVTSRSELLVTVYHMCTFQLQIICIHHTHSYIRHYTI